MENAKMKLFTEFLKDDSGATAIEYGLIAAATGLVLVTAGPLLSDALQGVFGQITTGLNDAAAPAAP
jgi:pilus assembly protein Flp/PilA